MSDFHNILGIAPNASKSEIKKAYRAKALSVHPDVNDSPEAQQLFIELSLAYEALLKNNQPVLDNVQQKYWNVYQPPAEEHEYVKWKEVDEERRKYYQEKARWDAMRRKHRFEQEVHSFRQSIFFYPMMAVYYIFMLAFLFTGVLSVAIPIYVKLNSAEYNFTDTHILLMTCCVTPISFIVFLYLRSLKKDIDPLFGIGRK